jgi:hypothetical protein
MTYMHFCVHVERNSEIRVLTPAKHISSKACGEKRNTFRVQYTFSIIITFLSGYLSRRNIYVYISQPEKR